MQYEFLWRNKFMTTQAESIDDMISVYDDTLKLFKEMKEAGVVLSHGQEDDYATLVTDNKEVADRFGFDEPFCEDEEEVKWESPEGF